ncbi:MAG TPA: hypothetical protein VK213_01345 [Bacteroidales bacterium]|nr:hypothetical protein [Bacteroidales bacterium]
MTRANKILKFFLIALSAFLIISCAPTRKNTYYQKRKKASHVNSEQLGRNKYFFSPQYQKKLNSNYKKRK